MAKIGVYLEASANVYGHLFLFSFVKYVISKLTQSKRGYRSARLYGQYFV